MDLSTSARREAQRSTNVNISRYAAASTDTRIRPRGGGDEARADDYQESVIEHLSKQCLQSLSGDVEQCLVDWLVVKMKNWFYLAVILHYYA